MIDIYTALTIGLIGSFHCIGMCGPIAVALPLGSAGLAGRAAGALLYNIGRSITYGFLGAVFGLLGRGVKLAGFQQWASILIGAVMILTVVLPVVLKGRLHPGKLIDGYSGGIIRRFRGLFGKHSFRNLFMIGLLNGFLPCGLVYVAVAGALNTNDMVTGIIYMLAFGLGTTPIMLSISMAGNVISRNLRDRVNKLVPPFVFLLGVLFILRGLSLGIPYISPKTEKLSTDKEVSANGACCNT